MSRRERAGWAAPLAGLLAYAAWVLFDLPAPRYVPLERALTMTPAASAITMAWYGRLTAALLIAALTAFVFRGSRPSGPRPAWLAVALFLLVLTSLAAFEASHWIIGR